MAFFNLNSVELTDEHHKTLDAIYDTFIPSVEDEGVIKSLLQAHAPNDPALQDQIRQFLALKGSRSSKSIINILTNGNMISGNDLVDLKFAIHLLSTSYGTFFLTGYYQPFYLLSGAQREAAFKSLFTSFLVQKRLLANAFRALLLLVWCCDVECPALDLNNPFLITGPRPDKRLDIWAAMQYPGPPETFCPVIKAKFAELKKQNRIWTLPPLNFLKQYPTPTFSASYQDLIDSKVAPLRPLLAQSLQYDVVIIGSGAGAGPCALQLSQAGYRVLVVEQGGYNSPENYNGLESEAFVKSYLNGAALTTVDKTVTVLAGAGFGGGTAINWSASLDTPHYVREEWTTDYGLKFAASSAFTHCLDRVKNIMQVHPHPEECHNKPNQLLLSGAAKLGMAARTLNQNGIGPHDCGWCSTGCKLQSKQGSNVSFLPISINRYGAHVITNAKAEKVLFESFPHWTPRHHDVIKTANDSFAPSENIEMQELNLSDRYPGENHEPVTVSPSSVSSKFIPQTKFDPSQKVATGILVSYQDPTTKQLVQLEVHSKIVVVAAGALHTPLVLQRSGIQHPHLGKNLRLHPVIGVAGFYDEVIDPWSGTQMTSICTATQNLHNNYGAVIETPNAHLGLIAGAVPWWGGTEFKAQALKMRHLCAFICLTREMTSSGSVYENAANGAKVQIDYNFTSLDRAHLLETIIAAAKIHTEAGANEIITPFIGQPSFHPDPILKTSDPRFEEYVISLRNHGIIDHTVQILSAHQMGTARASADPKKGPVGPSGEVHNVNNLFVADASLFPTASGVNPMLTVMALSQYVSLAIQQRLERLNFIDSQLALEKLPSLFNKS